MKKLLAILLLLPILACAQIKVKNLPTTTGGTSADYLIKDYFTGNPGSTQKITVANFLSTYSLSPVWTTSGSNIYNNNSGKVGIGTASPTQKLTVDGNMEFKTDGNYIKYRANATDSAYAAFGETGSGCYARLFSKSYDYGYCFMGSSVGHTNQLTSVGKGSSTSSILQDSNKVVVSGNNTFGGIKYYADYSTGFTARSLVDSSFCKTQVYTAHSFTTTETYTMTLGTPMVVNTNTATIASATLDFTSLGTTNGQLFSFTTAGTITTLTVTGATIYDAVCSGTCTVNAGAGFTYMYSSNLTAWIRKQ